MIINLQDRCYDFDFVLNNGSITCAQDKSLTKPEDFEITEKHVIADNRCLESASVIFAVHILVSNTKGVLMSSYGHRRNNSKKISSHES